MPYEEYYVLAYYVGDMEIEHDIIAMSDKDAQQQAYVVICGQEGLFTCISLVSCDTAWSFDYSDCEWHFESSAYDEGDGMEHAEYDPYGDEQLESPADETVPF